MLKLAAFAVVGALSAMGAAQAVVSLDQARRDAAPAGLRGDLSVSPEATELSHTQDPAQGQAASIAKSVDGHYWAEATVNASRVRFLVDTGATAVALTLEDARRLGFDPARLDYAYKVTTASGEARAAQVRLASVSVAGAAVADVEALVIEKGLETSLLGMTYLGRLSRFEATRTALILRP